MMAWAILAAGFALLVGVIVWRVKAAKREGSLTERIKQATRDTKLAKAAENVAKLAGPATDRIGEYYRRMRDRRK